MTARTTRARYGRRRASRSRTGCPRRRPRGDHGEPGGDFGLGAVQGRIAPGQVADLVLWSGDPLEVTTVAEQVWIDGRPQSTRSRQTELRDRYRPRSP
jgi:hypothetical protein